MPGSASFAAITAGAAHSSAIVTVRTASIGGGGNLYLLAGPGEFLLVNGVKFFDWRTPVSFVVNAGGVLGTSANIAGALAAVSAAAPVPSVRCWGLNGSGQLGLGNTNNVGDDESPITSVNLGGATPTAIGAGGQHTCALLTGGARAVLGAQHRRPARACAEQQQHR